MVKTLIVLACLVLSGCAMSPIPIGLPCSVGPFIADKGASTRWTRSEKEQLIVINSTGEALCRWKPPQK
jgi:hypothetical protein